MSQFIEQFDAGEEYDLVIDQRGSRYDVTVDVIAKNLKKEEITVRVVKSDYGNDSWDGSTWVIEKDQTVREAGGNPFGPIGRVYSVE